MVEGIAEALLLPVLARIAGGNLKDSAVTVLNADGINFNAFLPLFGNGRLGLPVAILTDGDDAAKNGTPSATTRGLKAKEADIPNLRVEFGQITFEHELARSPALLPLMLDAYESLHPTIGSILKTTIVGQGTNEEKADTFLAAFLRSKTSKGEFAQELAGLLEGADLTADAVPKYIRDVLVYLDVIKNKGLNEPDGEASTTNPVPEAN
jgi:putative ATP-dependent endonuclease of OLD family